MSSAKVFHQDVGEDSRLENLGYQPGTCASSIMICQETDS
jgi:hypothetical protein